MGKLDNVQSSTSLRMRELILEVRIPACPGAVEHSVSQYHDQRQANTTENSVDQSVEITWEVKANKASISLCGVEIRKEVRILLPLGIKKRWWYCFIWGNIDSPLWQVDSILFHKFKLIRIYTRPRSRTVLYIDRECSMVQHVKSRLTVQQGMLVYIYTSYPTWPSFTCTTHL